MVWKLPLVGAMCVMVTGIGHTWTGTDSPPDAPVQAPAPRPARVFKTGTSGGGLVTAVAKDSIMVKALNIGYALELGDTWSEDGLTVTMNWRKITLGPDGERSLIAVRVVVTRDSFTAVAADGTVTSVQLANQVPRRFIATGPLAEGGYDNKALPEDTYRLADVQVGDWIRFAGVRYTEATGVVDYVTTIRIIQRPGGRVPPALGEDADPFTRFMPCRWHERVNAWQDWDERGIPPPANITKIGGSPFRTYRYPPLAPMPRTGVSRVEAPEPREVVPRIPAAKP